MATQTKAEDSSAETRVDSDTSSGSQDFRLLIEDAQSGSPTARNELIQSLHSYLILIARQELDSRLRAKVGPSDMVQSALVLAEKNLNQFRGTTRQTLLAWLRTILRNQIHATHRKYLHSEKRDAYREVNANDSQHGVVLADGHPSPQTEAVLHEEALSLREALKRLPKDYRTVVALRNWERLPFDLIGERMNRSTAAAKKLWARAVRQLQKELNCDSRLDSI